MNYRLGKRPARPGAIRMRFGAYFMSPNLPPSPVRIGKPGLVRTWGMLANDQYGDCVWAGAAHETMMLNAAAGAPVTAFSSADVLSDYSAVTGFSASDPKSDQGTDVSDAARYRQKTGIVDAAGRRHTIDIYTALSPGDLRQLALAVQYLGIAGVGVLLPSNAEDQFDAAEPWHLVTGFPPEPGNGHYVPCVGRNSQGNFVFVSWGRLQAAEPAWVSACMDEAVAYLSRERLKSSGLSPDGLDLAKLEDDYKQITGSS